MIFDFFVISIIQDCEKNDEEQQKNNQANGTVISTSGKDRIQDSISADGNENQEDETEQQQTNEEYGRINEIEFIHSDDHTVNRTVATDSNQMINEISSRKPRILTGDQLNGWFIRRKSRK